MFAVRFSSSVMKDLSALRAHERRTILEAIEGQLPHEPTRTTRNRKKLEGVLPPWPAAPPIWQLRLGELRVFYDVDLEAKCVYIRAVRRKPPHKTTEEIL